MKAKSGGLGDRYSFMWRNGYFPLHTVMASGNWNIDRILKYKNNKNGRRYRADSYVDLGMDVIAFRKAAGSPMPMPNYPTMLRPQVALKRLYEMRKIAMNLPRALSAIGAAQAGFSNSSIANDFLAYASPIQTALGVGLTTVFHATTDMGYQSIKPDTHAARTLAHFQLLEYENSNNGNIINADAFNSPLKYLNSDWKKCLVVGKAVALARSLAKNQLLPQFNGNACREVDIVLMQASLHDVILKY